MLKIYEYSTPNKLLSHDNKLEMLQSGYGWDEELFIYKSDTTSSITSNITPQIGSIIAIKLTDFAYPYAFLVQDVDENNKISLLNVGYNLWGETEIPPIQLGKSLKSIIDYLTDENFIRYNVIFAYSGIDNIKYTYRMTVVTKILDIVERLTKQFNIFVTSYIKDDALNIKFEIGASQQYKLQTNITHDVSIETNLTDSQIANFVTTYLDDKFYKM